MGGEGQRGRRQIRIICQQEAILLPHVNIRFKIWPKVKWVTLPAAREREREWERAGESTCRTCAAVAIYQHCNVWLAGRVRGTACC